MADHALTDAGRTRREEVELATDAQMRPGLDALGDDLQELAALLTEWDEAVMAAGGYPNSPLAITPRGH
jgi:hypothetical protein